MIYHLPGERDYRATVPEMCFATEADAVAAGYRPIRRFGAEAQRSPASAPESRSAATSATSGTTTPGAAGASTSHPSQAAAGSAAGAATDRSSAGPSATPSGTTGLRGAVEGTGTRDCPAGYPIKGNASSMIFHQPGERYYNVTIPELCFATEEDAVAAGYRPYKHAPES